MSGDEDLSRRLTAAIRGTDGVTGVYAVQPVLEAAATSVVAALEHKPTIASPVAIDVEVRLIEV